MKKIIYLFVLTGLFFVNQAFAGNGDLFKYDKADVQAEMAELNELENLLESNMDITYDYLLEVKNPLIDNLGSSADVMDPLNINGPIIPSFWWGCLAGPLGVVIVYLYEEDDRAELRKSIWGCVISSVLWGGGWAFRGNLGI